MENAINKQIKILLVEDNLINIKVFTTILGDYGYSNITVAKTGEHALSLALGSKLDNALLDSSVEAKKENNQKITTSKDLNSNVALASNVDLAPSAKLDVGITQNIQSDPNAQLPSTAPFDIIFLDIGLPDITGLEVCKKIRQQLTNQTIPIIVLTACGADAEEESFQAGCSEFFIKPVNAEQLISTIERWSKIKGLDNHDYFY